MATSEFHGGFGAPAPPSPSPPPAHLKPPPLRYPETINSLIAIRDTEDKGLGVFALQDIEPGTVLLCEAPLVELVDTGTRADPLDAALSALSPSARESFFSLSYYSSNPHESPARSIIYSNGYSIRDDLSTGLFETASRINHSCVPNSKYVWDVGLERMIFWNRWKLLEGEEVCVDYGHGRRMLKRIYGFDCMCGGCTEGSEGARSGEEGEAGERLGDRVDEVVERQELKEKEEAL